MGEGGAGAAVLFMCVLSHVPTFISVTPKLVVHSFLSDTFVMLPFAACPHLWNRGPQCLRHSPSLYRIDAHASLMLPVLLDRPSTPRVVLSSQQAMLEPVE